MNPPRKSARGRSFGLRFLVRLVGWSFSAAVALIVLSYVALPALLRYGLPHALSRYGVVSSMEGARVSLTNEQVTLVGFQVGQAGGPAIRWGEVTARVEMAELLRGNIRIIEFQVKDARVDLAQLRASRWRPPDRAVAIPELGGLNIDIGNVVLRDLEFIDLSERVGQKVKLHSLSVGSLSHLEAGARVAFQLQGAVGDGSLRLAGQARMVENLPLFEGRYELGALELKGFGQLFGLATPRSVGGKVDGNGTFSLEVRQTDGTVAVDLTGSARVDGLELDSGETSITGTTANWSGEAEVFFPLSGGPPRFIARGSVASPTLEAARRKSAAPYGIFGRGLRWSGEMRRGSEFETDGRLSGDLLRIVTRREGERRLEIELSRFRSSSGYRSGRGRYAFETGKLAAKKAILTQVLDAGRQSVVAFRLVLEKARLGTDGHYIEGLEAESAEATIIEGAAIEPSRSARLISLGASKIEISTGGRALIGQLEIERAGIDIHEQSIDLSQVRARSVEAGVEAPFEAEAISASYLRQKSGVFETWGSNLRFSSAGISASGGVFSDQAAAQSLSQTMAGDPLWQANGVRAARLAIGSRQIEAGKLSAGRFAYGKLNQESIEIERGEGADFSIRYGSGIDAKTVKLESMRYRSGQIAVLEFAAAELKAPGIDFQGELSARGFDADSVRYLDADANVYLLERPSLGGLSGRFSTGIRIDAVRAGRFLHDRAAGADYEATELELSRTELSAAGGASAVMARLNRLEITLADDNRLSLKDVAAAHPARNAGGRFTADGGRVRTLSYNMPGGRIFELLDIDVGAIDGDENDGHRISSVSAASATASDPAAEAELKTGAVQIAAIRISADQGVSAEVASANAVSLAGFDADTSAAFSSDRISVGALTLRPGERLRLGKILLDDAVLTMGFDKEGELVLPELPFFSAERNASESLTIERLETRQPARLGFFDRSIAPPFDAVIFPLQARLENFHNRDPGRRAEFMLDGSMDESLNLEASGQFSVERDGLNLKVSGKVVATELERLGTYVAKHAKHAIQSGRGDAAFDIAVRGRRLSGTIRFVFTKVRLEPDKAFASAEGRNGEQLPLKHAFAMLEDKDGMVRLTVPLSGSFDDPGFNLSQGLIQAVSKSVRRTAMLTFKPLGLLVGAVGVSEGLEFRPVAFDPGEQRLDGDGLAHLDTLARALKTHPGFQVGICGRAVSADRIRIEQRQSEVPPGAQPLADEETSGPASVDFLLQKLAQQRASAVRRHLEENNQIRKVRLLSCEAKVESAPGRLPRVDLPVRLENESAAVPDSRSPG